MTLRCIVCWQPILPHERHVVLDAAHTQGEHLACASFFRRRESRRSPGQAGVSQAPKGSLWRPDAPVGGTNLRAATLPVAVAHPCPAVTLPAGRGARSLAPICALRSEDTRDGRSARVPSDGSGR